MSVGAATPPGSDPVPFGSREPDGTFVFVSYAHADSTVVYPELKRIASLGVRVWFDEGISPASRWPEEIARAIGQAALFIAMITPDAVTSANVSDEIYLAHRLEKPVLAIHLAPTSLPPGLDLQLGSRQAIMRWQLDDDTYARKLAGFLADYADPLAASATTMTHAATPAFDARGPFIEAWSVHLGPESDDGAAVMMRELARFHHDSELNSVAFSADGARLATAGGNLAQIWDVSTCCELARLEWENVEIELVAFSPDGTRLVTGSGMKSSTRPLLWDAATGRLLGGLRQDGDGGSRSVAFSPDGTRLAAGSTDGIAWIWDATTGRELTRLYHHDHCSVDAVAFSPDSARLVTGIFFHPAYDTVDGVTRIWDISTGRELTRFQHDDEHWVMSAAFSPDGTRIATGGGYLCLTGIWDASTGRALTRLRHDGSVYSVAFSPDGTRLATANGDERGVLHSGKNNFAQIWDTATGQEITRLQFDQPPRSVDFNPDGTWLATGSRDNLARIWAAA